MSDNNETHEDGSSDGSCDGPVENDSKTALDDKFFSNLKSSVKNIMGSLLQSTSDDKQEAKSSIDVDQTLSALESIMKDMFKYQNKPYLANSVMTGYFDALSKLKNLPVDTDNLNNEPEFIEYTQAVGSNSKKICDMLQDNTIEYLCGSPEFKEHLLKTVVNFNKLIIFAAKKGIEKMELEMTHINDDTPVDNLLENLYSKLHKKV